VFVLLASNLVPDVLNTSVQISAEVSQACSCPVVVVKNGEGAGALLKVVPRRVFIYVERSAESKSTFEWAMAKLINPEIDEVCLMRDKAAFCMDGSQSFASMEEERLKTAKHMDSLVSSLRGIGVCAVKKFRNVDCSAESLVSLASSNSCDLLVCCRNETGMYAAHSAPFPVVISSLEEETKAAAHAELPSVLQFWGGHVDQSGSSSNASDARDTSQEFEAVRSSHDFGDEAATCDSLLGELSPRMGSHFHGIQSAFGFGRPGVLRKSTSLENMLVELHAGDGDQDSPHKPRGGPSVDLEDLTGRECQKSPSLVWNPSTVPLSPVLCARTGARRATAWCGGTLTDSAHSELFAQTDPVQISTIATGQQCMSVGLTE
jgi:hypothetical protein